MENPYTGLTLRSEDRYFGEPSDFGGVVCHGCDTLCDMGEWHRPGCPKKCTREDCGYHFYIAPLVDKLEGKMKFTREEYENLPARRLEEFKKFVLERFGDYTKFTTVKGAKHPSGEANREIGVVEDPLKKGWGGWKVYDRSLLDDSQDYFIVNAYMEDERVSTSYYDYVRVPKAFVFGELEADEEYQLYMKLKERFEGGQNGAN